MFMKKEWVSGFISRVFFFLSLHFIHVLEFEDIFVIQLHVLSCVFARFSQQDLSTFLLCCSCFCVCVGVSMCFMPSLEQFNTFSCCLSNKSLFRAFKLPLRFCACLFYVRVLFANKDRTSPSRNKFLLSRLKTQSFGDNKLLLVWWLNFLVTAARFSGQHPEYPSVLKGRVFGTQFDWVGPSLTSFIGFLSWLYR